jgi:hypothetical protein
MSAEKPTTARARPARVEVEQGERQRRRTNLDASFDLQLPVDESRLDRKSFTYRWVNDARGRVHRITTQDDWERVSAEEAGVEVEHQVGYHPDGKPLKAILLKKPLRWHQDDQARKIAQTREVETEMKRRPPAVEGGISDAEGYVVSGTGVRAGVANLKGRQAEVVDED